MPLQPTTKATLTSASRMGRQLTQGCFYALSLLFFEAYLCAPALAQSLSKGVGDLRVMTYNANEGTDFLEVQQTTTSFEFLEAVGQTITQVRATNPAERMASQGLSVDWFRFWMQGYEDSDPAKAEQYRRWQELRKIQEESSKGK